MQDADDFDPRRLSPHLVDDDERRSRNNQLARSTPAAGAAGLRVIAQQHVGALADSERHREGAARAFKLDAIEYRVERRFGLPEPDDGNAQAPRVFKRAMRASRRPMTSSCGTHSAAGSSASLKTLLDLFAEPSVMPGGFVFRLHAGRLIGPPDAAGSRLVGLGVHLEAGDAEFSAHKGGGGGEIAPQARLSRALRRDRALKAAVAHENGPAARLAQNGRAPDGLSLDEALHGLAVDDFRL